MSEQHQPPSPPDVPGNPSAMTDRQTYNVVADTLVGANVRWKDNLIQAVAIFISMVLGAAIGVLVMSRDRMLGLVVGGFAGVLFGLFTSGIALMLFRAVMHLRGRHD